MPIRDSILPIALTAPSGAGGRVLLAAGLLLALLLGAPAPARADDRIWSGIVLASQKEKPKAPPAELQRVAGRIERFFGYNQLELIGSATKEVDEECERWLVPSQHFWLCVKARRASGERNYGLCTTLYHDQRSIVETEAKLGADTPLIIRGPMHAKGQLLIVLQLLK